MSASQDGSESVDQFLARIASVKEGRDHASEERTRRMEEDFLKNRKERQARRLERARSLSPSKTGPSTLSTTQPSSTAARDTALNPPVDFSPRTSTLSRSNAFSARTSPTLEGKRPELEPTPIVKEISSPTLGASGLARSGTLSWQQRPPRDGAINRPRPLSSVGHIRVVPKKEEDDTAENVEPTRQQIAASLSAKDPTWFRQTQDRGLGSAALRKNQVEDTIVMEHTTRSQILPGMSKDGSKSATETPTREVQSTPDTTGSGVSSSPNERVRREPSPALPTLSDVPKLVPSPQQTLRAEPSSDGGSSSLTRSGSILSGRPPSPTKGLGGFVESAMMKRSDSVSKRWSVQANNGLKRGDSVAGMRPLSGIRSLHASSPSRVSHRDNSPSPAPNSRPQSRDGPTNAQSQTATPDQKAGADELVKDTTQSATATNTTSRPETPTDDQLSRSPSRTLDSRRWSPTKSSWLESALLSKPEPPKPQAKKEEIPAWKATLQRNKASRDLSPEKFKATSVNALPDVFQDSKKPDPPPLVGKKPEYKSTDADLTSQQSLPDRMKIDEAKVPPKSPTPIDQQKSGQLMSKPTQVELVNLDAEEKGEKKAPPVLKPKPQTPPKTDFRATLRSRAPVQAKDTGAEPEFRSIFGKLKKTETQNYVAPDTLKDNILGGKAALNITSGPQKTQRVDEFKESILQKKEAMKTGALQKKDNPVPDIQSKKSEPIMPEALARRKTLQKSTPASAQTQSSPVASSNTKQEASRPPVTNKPKPVVSSSSIEQPVIPSSVDSVSPDAEEGEAAQLIQQSQKPISSQQPIRKTEPSAAEKTPTAKVSDPTTSPTQELSPVPAVAPPKSELPPGSKLASRLNPNLAAFLTRGGSPHPPSARSPSPGKVSSSSISQITKAPTTEGSGGDGELTHMTKGRAKGPKRRAPKAKPAQAVSSVDDGAKSEVSKPVVNVTSDQRSTPLKSVASIKETFTTQPATKIAREPGSIPISIPVEEGNKKQDQNLSNDEEKLKPKPAVVSKSPELRKVSSPLGTQQMDGGVSKSQSSQFEIATDQNSAPKPVVQPKSRELPATPKPELQPKPRDLPATPKLAATASPLTPSKSRVNTPKPAQATTNLPSKPQSPKPVTGLGVTVKTTSQKPSISANQLTPPPERPTMSTAANKIQPQSSSSMDLTPIISAYLPKPLDRQQLAEFDAHNLLMRAQAQSEKIKSLNHAIWELSSDGKKSALSPGQEHILFEESLYLVTHSFQSDAGAKSSEVYLWCGDEVAEAAVEDAQLFCRKDAREHSAKLEVIKQGKEPARFFQALGGILITRRNKTSSLYMLRGRRHLGHIAFDEVELIPSNLCSGFAYLISAKFGKLYLWNGKGSGADEVGCARLIGMDLGLTGEIEEVAEGKEPASFWESFPRHNKQDPTWSEDWQRRADHDCYPTTLYRVDLDRPKSAGGFWGLRSASPPKPSNKVTVDLISPFCDRDLDPSNVYVLDAYRSIYVILNSQAMGKSTEVVTALHLAQELAMLSPSVQDRSLLPSCNVVFGEPPADVKVCFRKWSRPQPSKTDKPAACHKLEDVMDALKL